jgi:two-component system, NtrC family, response regulator
MGNVLIVDDDRLLREALSAFVADLGHRVLPAGSLEEGRARAISEPVDLVFLDVRLPDGDGLDAIPFFRKVPSSPQVVIITGVGDPDGAAMAIRSGVWDYLQKPFSTEEIERQIRRVMEYRRRRGPVEVPDPIRRDGIVGSGPGLMACLDKVARCAAGNGTVLITGETGTGKGRIARAIHANSLRADKRFVTLDCAAVPEALVESLLFGSARGESRGGEASGEGLLRRANGGTLFLDEVGEMPAEAQKRFLRVLQDDRFHPMIGPASGGRESPGDFRIVAATRRNLWRLADRGLFRKDLLLRLQTFHIDVPPLRERREDLAELLLHFMHRHTQRNGMTPKAFSRQFFEILESYEWPGNVRELMDATETALLRAGSDPVLYPVYLPESIRLRHVREAVARKRTDGDEEDFPTLPAVSQPARALPPFRDVRDATLLAMEESYLRRLLAETGGNIDRMRDISELGKSRLYGLLRKHGISSGGPRCPERMQFDTKNLESLKKHEI